MDKLDVVRKRPDTSLESRNSSLALPPSRGLRSWMRLSNVRNSQVRDLNCCSGC